MAIASPSAPSFCCTTRSGSTQRRFLQPISPWRGRNFSSRVLARPAITSRLNASSDGELLYELNYSSHHRRRGAFPVDVTLPSDAVGPTAHTMRRKKAMVQSFRALAAAGVEGVVMEVWWWLVEREFPRSYSWQGYLEIVELAKRFGLKVRAMMAFHQYGSGPDDLHWIPLPLWVLEVMDGDPDVSYADRFGRRNTEYVSLGCDILPILHGRSPIQAYTDLMRSFKETFKSFLGGIITGIQVGLGPGGELRYPSCPTQKLTRAWRSRELGEFQCYDKVGLVSSISISRIRPEIYCCAYGRPNRHHNAKRCETLPQNVDLPPILPKKKKKPYPIPLKKIQQAARADKKLAHMGIEKPLEPPKNGLLVPDLIPVAYEVLDAWKVLIEGLAQLLHVIPVHACSECSEIHVAQIGHEIQDCHGPTSGSRKSFHSWIKASINDVLLPIESYHMYDPFGRRIRHETRFNYDRIPAVVELCIQAGVELPEYPSRRRTEPIRMIGKKVIDLGGYVEEPRLFHPGSPRSAIMELDTYCAMERFPPPVGPEVRMIAQGTLNAYEKVKRGVTKLMKKYSVKACGYCSEVHVGPWGHNAKLCGEFKHQWRDGKHGWQDATVDEVFPPNYVWHVEDPKGPALVGALKRFYGKAPAVVEVCIQAGARVPVKYRPMMRVDIVVPEDEEARLVA